MDASGALHIGAAVCQARAAAHPAVRDGWPLLAAASEHIGHPQFGNRGTVFGRLAHHDPAAELPATALALDARFVIAGPRGTRTVTAEDFFVATFRTAVEPDELLTEVVIPPPTGRGWAFEELTCRHATSPPSSGGGGGGAPPPPPPGAPPRGAGGGGGPRRGGPPPPRGAGA
ncbi:FAD binding domain-containing protein, partial [Streptomyces sp. NPDC002088]|uniref:FAD binding domain-containing protein n=1 Tax=Streptomyces sp. NPDC002088 TaxID=3154665 RepID=UPI003323EE72